MGLAPAVVPPPSSQTRHFSPLLVAGAARNGCLLVSVQQRLAHPQRKLLLLVVPFTELGPGVLQPPVRLGNRQLCKRVR